MSTMEGRGKMRAPRKRDGSKFSLKESRNIVKKSERLMGRLEDLLPLVYEDGKIVGVQVSSGDLEELMKLRENLEELTDLMDLDLPLLPPNKGKGR